MLVNMRGRPKTPLLLYLGNILHLLHFNERLPSKYKKPCRINLQGFLLSPVITQKERQTSKRRTSLLFAPDGSSPVALFFAGGVAAGHGRAEDG